MTGSPPARSRRAWRHSAVATLLIVAPTLFVAAVAAPVVNDTAGCAYSDCQSCAADSGCGWCPSQGACLSQSAASLCEVTASQGAFTTTTTQCNCVNPLKTYTSCRYYTRGRLVGVEVGASCG